jgi:hypothetical protein
MTARDHPLRDDVLGLFVGKKLSCNGIHSHVCMLGFQAETSDIAFSRLLLTMSIMARAYNGLDRSVESEFSAFHFRSPSRYRWVAKVVLFGSCM